LNKKLKGNGSGCNPNPMNIVKDNPMELLVVVQKSKHHHRHCERQSRGIGDGCPEIQTSP